MASISTDKGGNRRIIFSLVPRNRKAIYLGDMPLRDVREILTKVKALVSEKLSKSERDPAVARWVGEIPDVLAEKLVKVELIAPRMKSSESVQRADTIDEFIDAYLAERVDLKASTVVQLQQVQKNLRKFVGDKITLREFTAGHADAFKASLTSKLADNSVRRNLGRCRQFFEAAVRRRMIDSNPFSHIKGVTVKGNAERFQFVTLAEIKRVIDAAPDAQWRLIIALARYGGIRTPSETLALKWSDVDWKRQRIRVPSPKTERCGKSFREIPLFPELLPYLQDSAELAAEKTEHMITRYRDASQNLRTTMLKIIKRAGLEPWERVFHNLRASRQTELARIFPSHVVCDWIGNSKDVAEEHYLNTLDDDFQRATEEPTRIPTRAAAEMRADCGNVRQDGTSENAKAPAIPGRSHGFTKLQSELITRPGFEPGQTEPKSVVLPLHYRVSKTGRESSAACWSDSRGSARHRQTRVTRTA